MLNLFWKTKDKTLNLIPKPFSSEAEFESYIFQNQDLLPDISILYRQIHTGNKQGIPDMLGVDQDSRICVIEFKNIEVSEDILPQILSYAMWAETNPDSIKAIWLESKNRPEDKGIDWDSLDIRIIIIAPSFRANVLKMSGKIGFPVDLIQIRKFNFENEDFILVETLEEVPTSKAGITKPTPIWDWEYYEKEHDKEATQQFHNTFNQIQEFCYEQNWALTNNINQSYTGFKWGNKVVFDVAWQGTHAWRIDLKIPEDIAKNFSGENWDYKGFDNNFHNAIFKLKPQGEINIDELKPLFKLAFEKIRGIKK